MVVVVPWGFIWNMSMSVNLGLGRRPGSSWSLHLLLEIEMVIMERSKLPELASTSVQEQNTTDEEKSAATGLESARWSR